MAFEAHGAVQTSAPAAAPVEAPASAPTPETTPTPATTPAPAAGTTGEPAPVEFSTDYKVKVLDQEHEVDEFLRGSIKDEKSWNRVKELYEKSIGLDAVKPKYAEAKRALDERTANLESIQGQIGNLRQLYSSGDFDGFFEQLKIPQQKILEWVLEKAQYQEMDPHQQRLYDERRTLKRQNLELANQTETFQTRIQEQESKALGFMLNVELDKQDVKSFSDKFDARAGKPGAFRDAVIELGENAYYASQGRVTLSPDQAVAKTLERYKAFLGEPLASAPAPTIVQAPPATGAKPRSLPNLASKPSSASVAAGKPRSIEDLKKLHKELSGQT